MDEFGELFYELHLYGIFLSEVADIIKEIMVENIDHIASSFAKKLVFDEDIKCKVFKLLADKYKELVESHSSKIYGIVKSCLGIKNNILLPNDDIYKIETTEKEELELTNQVENLTQKYFTLIARSELISDLLEQFDGDNQMKNYQELCSSIAEEKDKILKLE